MSRIAQALRVAVYHLSGVVPRSPRLVLFGAWHGHRYADNPRYLFEFAREEYPNLRLVWCGHDVVRADVPTGANTRFVDQRSLRAAWYSLRASVVVVSHGYADVLPVNLTRGATVVNLGHGIAIKNMGSAGRAGWARRSILGRVQRSWRSAESSTYFVASSDVHQEKLVNEHASQGARVDNTLQLGQPRCDLFADERATSMADAMRARLARQYGVGPTQRLVLYMPTFRDRQPRPFSFRNLPAHHAGELRAVLARHDAVLLERSHFVDGVLRDHDDETEPVSVVDLSAAQGMDAQELLLVADVLVTDYSGAYVDYLLLDRPVIHFVYDYQEYLSSDRGLYFDLEDVAGGQLVHDVDELLRELEACLNDPSGDAHRRARLREYFLGRERGRSARDVAAHVLPSG